MMKCPKCGREMREGYLFCSKDGAFSFANEVPGVFENARSADEKTPRRLVSVSGELLLSGAGSAACGFTGCPGEGKHDDVHRNDRRTDRRGPEDRKDDSGRRTDHRHDRRAEDN